MKSLLPKEMKPQGAWVMAAVAATLLAAGGLFARWSALRQEQWMREDLLRDAHQFALTLNVGRIENFAGTESDASTPDYRRLKQQLIAARQINPEWEWIYLLGRKTDGPPFFYIDSGPEGAPNTSTPGQAYKEASDELTAMFGNSHAVVEGPLPDRWGNWVSALVPLKAPQTGQTLAVLGIDVDAATWIRKRNQAMQVPGLATLALVAIWLAGNLLLARRARLGDCRTWVCPYLEAILAMATGLVLSALAGWLVRQAELRTRGMEFQHVVQSEIQPFRDTAEELRDLVMNGIAAFIGSAEKITGEEFRQYTAHLFNEQAIAFWGWADTVEAADRAPFEADAAGRTGRADYRIWEPGGTGASAAAGERERYFPIVHLQTRGQNPSLFLGYDLGETPALQLEMETALQTQRPTALSADPLLLRTLYKKNGILLVRRMSKPRPDGRVNGLVIAGLDIDRWLQTSRNLTPYAQPLATLDLLELRDGQPPLWLGSTDSRTVPPVGGLGSLPPQTIVQPLLIFGKAYAIVARPTTAFSATLVSNVGATVLIGVALSAFVAGLLGFSVRRQTRLNQLLKDQARKLAESSHHFHLLAENNRIATWEIDAQGLYTEMNDIFGDILGYRPDELVGQVHFYDLTPAEDREKVKAAAFATMAKAAPIRDLVHPVKNKAGGTIWALTNGIPVRDDAGRMTGYWGTSIDITEHKRNEDMLAQLAREKQMAAERYAALIRASNTGAWEYNGQTRQFWCSPEYFTLLGYDPADFDLPEAERTAQTLWLDLIHPGDQDAALGHLTSYLLEPGPFYDTRYRMRRKDGTWAWIWARGQMVAGHDGTPGGLMLGTHIDVTASMRTEEALRENEQKYRMLAEGMKDVVWIADVEAGRWLYMSPSVEKMLGYTAEEILAHPMGADVVPEQRDGLFAQVRQHLPEFLAGQIPADTFFANDIDQVRKDGSVVHTEAVCRFWRNEQTGRVELHGTTRDITDRQRAEEALQENQELFAQFMSHSPVYAFIKEVTATESRVLIASENYKDMIGVPGSQMRGKTMAELFPPEFAAKITADDWAVASKGEVLKLDEELNGRHYVTIKFPIVQAGKTLLAGYTIDITDRKRAEAALETAVERYDLLARQNRVVTWELDLEGRYVAVSDMSTAVYGYRPDEVAGKMYFYSLTPEADREEFKRLGLEIMRKGEPVNDLLNSVITQSGQIIWVSSCGVPIRDAQGNLTGYWGTDTDITDRKLAEEALHESERKFRALTETMKDVVWIVDVETLKFIYISPSVEKLRGFTPAEVMAGTVANSLEPGQLEKLSGLLRENAAKFMKGEITSDTFFTLELQQPRKNASPITTEAIVRFSLNPQTGKLELHGVTRDITERKRVEQDYRTLFLNMIEGFALHEIVCDEKGEPVDYRFLAVNPAFERLTGLKAADIVGKTSREVLPGLDRSWIETYGNVALTGLPAFFTNFSAPLGRHYEVAAFQPAPGQFACIFSDVTERQLAENELLESRRQYATLVNNLPGMAYRFKNPPDWTLKFASPGSLELTGYAPEDLVDNKTIAYADLILPEFRKEVRAEWQRALREHRRYEGEYPIATRSGEVRWAWEQGEGIYDEKGQAVALEGFIADITARKQAEAERERLMRAIEQSGETIVITDTQGAILYVNPAFTQITGYAREEVLGQNPRILSSGKHDAAFYRQMWQTLEKGQTWEGQIINKRKDGSFYTEQAAISPVRDAAGHIVHFVAVKRDITRQLRDEAEKEALHTQLAHGQKLESIGRLAGGVSHDFNNMLQAILGYTEMALEQVPAGQPLHADLLEIQKTAQRSAALTRQLQTFARKEAGTPQVIDPNEAVGGLLSLLRRLIGEGIRLDWKPGPDIGAVKIDPGQFDQILTNLCINARDAVGPAGHIVIQTASATIARPNARRKDDLPNGTYVVLSVQDNGTGMEPDVIEHIFEPFFTTKPAGKGTGLGLATLYGIVKQNGGDVLVDSKPGKGSTFHIYLPRHEGKATAHAKPARSTEAPAGAMDKTILLVEDEETILRTTRRILETLGYQVLPANSAQEALRLFEKHKARIDLLVSDVIMPEINGPELTRRLLKINPKLRHLFISGYTANLLAEQGFGNNLDFIQKPFSRKALADKVQEILAKK